MQSFGTSFSGGPPLSGVFPGPPLPPGSRRLGLAASPSWPGLPRPGQPAAPLLRVHIEPVPGRLAALCSPCPRGRRSLFLSQALHFGLQGTRLPPRVRTEESQCPSRRAEKFCSRSRLPPVCRLYGNIKGVQTAQKVTPTSSPPAPLCGLRVPGFLPVSSACSPDFPRLRSRTGVLRLLSRCSVRTFLAVDASSCGQEVGL